MNKEIFIGNYETFIIHGLNDCRSSLKVSLLSRTISLVVQNKKYNKSAGSVLGTMPLSLP